MEQKICNINVKDLVLWTENPRDPINPNAKDQDVIDRAISFSKAKWELGKLAGEMGDYYDFSELPIVVYKDGKPIVYDGNRRVALAKIKLGFVSCGENLKIPSDIPEKLPCNVCDENTALRSIYRKHVKLRNTWRPLERDIFVSKYLGEEKSTFLCFDEATEGFISKHPELNQGFVRDEIFTRAVLSIMGFEREGDRIRTRHSDEEAMTLLNDILQKVKNKEITTRISRGDPVSVLDQRSKEIIESNKQNQLRDFNSLEKKESLPISENKKSENKKKTKNTRKTRLLFFGEKLILKSGAVNNLYSDIFLMYNYVDSNKKKFSENVYSLFRMSLRLLCETAASSDEFHNDIVKYINKFFSIAKNSLNQDKKTFLREQNISQQTLPQLLNSGAHNYHSSASEEKALGISIILGAMLMESHGKQKK